MMKIPPMLQQAAQQMIQQRFGNPQQALQAMRKQAGNNPVMNNALDLMEKGDYEGLNQLSQNLFKENNINPQNALQGMIQRLVGRGR